MGNCASCFGRDHKQEAVEDEESRLLYGDDPHGMHYGSFGEQHMSGPEDPVEVQREIEALQRVVARTSDNMVDIFEVAPQGSASSNPHATYGLDSQENRTARYQSLLTRFAGSDDEDAGNVEWRDDDDDTIEVQESITPIKGEIGEPFVGDFAEAAKAMG